MHSLVQVRVHYLDCNVRVSLAQKSNHPYTENSFFTPEGRMTDEAPLKTEIYQIIEPYASTSVPKKISNIIELLKITAHIDDFPPQTDRIHVANGTLFLDGSFSAAKNEIVRSRFPVAYEDENIWLTQKTMAQLYDVDVRTINYHIKKIFDDSELSEDSVIRKFRITATDGKPYTVQHYALQMIIAVGFKVNSERAVQFRKWVNQIATQYTIRGWVMDDERLKQGTYLTDKYFEEQLERIREIRASERKFYQKITDLYATAIDYDRTSAATKRFYATVQNKMHFAVHGHTAAELIMERADHTKDHMGLTTWQDAPDGKIKKSDVSIAKNYLTEDELGQLNRMVTSYLDFAENMAQRHIPLTMQDWETRLNRFIEMFEYGLLRDAGRVSAEIARLHAATEFEKYRVIQDREFLSDYDRFLLELEEHADAAKPGPQEEKP